MTGERARGRVRVRPAAWLAADALVVAALAGPAQTLLLFLLSPEIPLTLGGFAATFVALLPQVLVVYVLLGPTLVLLAMALRIGRTTRRGLSVRYLLRFAVLDFALLAFASLQQWRTLGELLPPTARVCLALATTTFVLGTVAALVLAWIDARRPGVVGVPWLVALGLAVLVALSATGALRRVKFDPPEAVVLPGFAPARPLLVVEIPALDARDLEPAIEKGSAEACASLAMRGTWLDLEPGRLSDPVSLHATLATGQGPERHGVLGAVRYRPRDARRSFAVLPRGLFVRPLLQTPLWERVPIDERALRVVALPSIARGLGVPQARIADPFDAPARGPTEFVLPEEALTTGAVHEVGGARVACPELGSIRDEFFDPPHASLPTTDAMERLVRDALTHDLCALAAARSAALSGRYGIVSVRLVGYYRVAYQFAGWRPDRPARGVSDDEIAAYGLALQRYLRRLDPELARLFEAAGDETLVALVSPMGIESRTDVERLVSELFGRTAPTGTHAGPPRGMAILAGAGVKRAQRLSHGVSLSSIVPTLLWAQGFPTAEDMGPIATGAFLEEFVRERPVFSLPSYGVPPNDAPTAAHEGFRGSRVIK